jgi:hypothetical protein
MSSSFSIGLFYRYAPLAISLLHFIMLIGFLYEGDDSHFVSAVIYLIFMSITPFLVWIKIYPKMKDVEIKGAGLLIDNDLIKWQEIRSIDFTIIGLYKVETKEKEILVIPEVPPRCFLNIDFSSDPFSLALKDFNKNRKYFFRE